MAEQTPVLAMLKSFLDVNNNSLYRFARYDPNSLRFWVAAVSMQLARIYGNDSQYLAPVFGFRKPPPSLVCLMKRHFQGDDSPLAEASQGHTLLDNYLIK